MGVIVRKLGGRHAAFSEIKGAPRHAAKGVPRHVAPCCAMLRHAAPCCQCQGCPSPCCAMLPVPMRPSSTLPFPSSPLPSSPLSSLSSPSSLLTNIVTSALVAVALIMLVSVNPSLSHGRTRCRCPYPQSKQLNRDMGAHVCDPPTPTKYVFAPSRGTHKQTCAVRNYKFPDPEIFQTIHPIQDSVHACSVQD